MKHTTHTRSLAFARSLKTLGLAAAFSLCAASLQAQTWTNIFQHSFDGLAADGLNGVAAGGGYTFVANDSFFKADGSIVGALSSTAGGAYIALDNLINSTKGTESGYFRLLTQIETTNNDLTVGFSRLAAPSTSALFYSGSVNAIATNRLSFQYQAGFSHTLNADSQAGTTAGAVVGSIQSIVTLDFRPSSGYNAGTNHGIMTVYPGTGGSMVRTATFTAAHEINSIFLGRYNGGASNLGGTGQLDSITLQQIPEPASAAALMALLVAGLCLTRRRTRK